MSLLSDGFFSLSFLFCFFFTLNLVSLDGMKLNVLMQRGKFLIRNKKKCEIFPDVENGAVSTEVPRAPSPLFRAVNWLLAWLN